MTLLRYRPLYTEDWIFFANIAMTKTSNKVLQPILFLVCTHVAFQFSDKFCNVVSFHLSNFFSILRSNKNVKFIRVILIRTWQLLYCNYGHILYRFRNKARYRSRHGNFFTPLFHGFKLLDHLQSLWISFYNFNTKCRNPYCIRQRKTLLQA